MNDFWSNRRLGLTVVGVMLLMATGGLILALATRSYRRDNDYRRGPTPNVPLQPPSEWSALGYLPAGTNLIAGVHVTRLFQDTHGKRLFDLPRPAMLDLVLDTVEIFAKLKPIEIDHVVFGAETATESPRLFFIVRTIAPYDQPALAKRMLPATPQKYREKTVFKLPSELAVGLIYCPDDRTMIGLFRLDAVNFGDLDAIPLPPKMGIAGLAKPLREAFNERLSKESVAWCAGDFERAPGIERLLAFTTLNTADREIVKSLRILVLGLYPQEGWTIGGSFLATDLVSVKSLEGTMKEMKLPGARSLKVDGPPPDVAEPWVSLQLRADSEGMRQILNLTKSPLHK